MNTEEKYKLPEPFRSDWLKNLRGGNYRQTQMLLYDGAIEGYCCLGLAEHTLGVEKEDMDALQIPQDLGSLDMLPTILHCNIGSLGQKLAGMNDDGKSFAEIADYIEENTIPE